MRPADLFLRRGSVLALLLVLSVCCAAVAALTGRDVVTALVGALLVVVYWLVERLTEWVGRRGSFGWAMAVGLVGMVLRLGLVVGGLVLVGLLDRPGFVDAVVSFVVVYTVYLGVRLLRFPVGGADGPNGDPGSLLTRRHTSAR